MKPITILNLLLLPVIVGMLWWLHVQRLKAASQREIAALQIVGYNYELTDEATGEAIETEAKISVVPSGTLQGHFRGSRRSARVTGRWIGKASQKITITAPDYEPRTVEVGVYSDEPQKLAMKRL